MIKFDLSLSSEILALIASIISFKRLRSSFLFYFIPFMAFIVTVELTGSYMARTVGKNHILYNITAPTGILFYLVYFYQLLPKHSKWVYAFAGSYITFVLINLLFIQKMDRFNSYSQMLGSFFLILLSCIYFIQAIQNGEQANVTLTNGNFWIVSGLFLSCLMSFIYWCCFEMRIDTTGDLFRLLIKSSAVVRYVLFTVAFLCHRIR